VLVVDDNATNRMVAEALCEMFGCTCETVVDGVEAVDAARSARFDLILMDIKMPRMDGVAATRAIRGLGGAPGSTPIVALTANADPEDVRRYLAVGMCDVVEKPIKPEKLLKAINDALAASGAALDAAAVAAA
jgi:CheY-like chemotaxis protein